MGKDGLTGKQQLLKDLELAFRSIGIFKQKVWHLSAEGKEFANTLRKTHDDIKNIIENALSVKPRFHFDITFEVSKHANVEENSADDFFEVKFSCPINGQWLYRVIRQALDKEQEECNEK